MKEVALKVMHTGRRGHHPILAATDRGRSVHAPLRWGRADDGVRPARVVARSGSPRAPWSLLGARHGCDDSVRLTGRDAALGNVDGQQPQAQGSTTRAGHSSARCRGSVWLVAVLLAWPIARPMPLECAAVPPPTNAAFHRLGGAAPPFVAHPPPSKVNGARSVVRKMAAAPGCRYFRTDLGGGSSRRSSAVGALRGLCVEGHSRIA